MKGQYKHLLNFTANLITLVFHGIMFALVWYFYYDSWTGGAELAPYAKRGNWAIIGIYILLVFFFTQVLGGYRIGYMRTPDIVLSCVLALLLANVVAYFELCLVWRDYVNPIPLLYIFLTECIFVSIWNFIIRRLYTAMYPPRQMLLVYGDYAPDDLIDKINRRHDKYNICETISTETNDFDVICKQINDHEAVVLCDLHGEVRNDLMKYCYSTSKRVYCTPKLTDIMFRAADDIHLFDTPLYLFRNQGLTIDQRFFKRVMDIVLSILGIIISSPIMLLIALSIKIYDGGPVFYKQERLTRDNKPFDVLKFRSMRVDSQKNGPRISAKEDDRITPVGRVIRKIHFDELPQLFNILIGEMSMVGPRPEWKVMIDQYVKEVPEFEFRTKVKAGLTGYAQVYGKYNTTPYDKVKLDLTYIENYSLWLDIKILLMTFKILFVKENTEGIDADQTSALKTGGQSNLTQNK